MKLRDDDAVDDAGRVQRTVEYGICRCRQCFGKCDELTTSLSELCVHCHNNHTQRVGINYAGPLTLDEWRAARKREDLFSLIKEPISDAELCQSLVAVLHNAMNHKFVARGLMAQATLYLLQKLGDDAEEAIRQAAKNYKASKKPEA